MNNEFSMKELYSVALKTTYPMEINGIEIEAGETVCFFDKIQTSNFNEIKKLISAHGGFDDRSFVTWDSTKEVRISFSQGIFSKKQLAIMCNANLVEKAPKESLMVYEREEKESNKDGIITFDKKTPLENNLYIYDKETGTKLSYTKKDSNNYSIGTPFKEVIADYYFDYLNGYSNLIIGKKLTEGYLSLEGKTRIKDDSSGTTKTGIIRIPRLKLMSGLSMRLGRDVDPVVGNMDIIAYPTGNKSNKRVVEFFFLNDDIDSDL